MAQTVLTQYVQEPNILQPLIVDELDWVQSNISGLTNSLATGLIGSFTSSKPCIINGIGTYTAVNQVGMRTLISGTTFSYAPAWIYEPNTAQIYYFSGQSSLDASLGENFHINVTYPDPADPVLFSDNVARNVMQLRSLSLDNTASGAAFQYSGLTSLRGDWIFPPLAPGSPNYQNNWIGNLFGGSGPMEYKFNAMSQRVEFQGEAYNSSTTGNSVVMITLPVGFRPPVRRRFAVIGDQLTGGNVAMVELVIESTGDVTANWLASPSGTLIVSFDSVSFSITD